MRAPHALLIPLLVLALASSAHAATASRHEPTVDQMVGLERAGSPAISPDGRWVAYTIRDTDWVENNFVTQIWLADAATGETRALTFGKKSNSAPAWSPDGSRLAFLSERAEKTQVWALDMRGGEAEKLTSEDDGVQRFAWSPKGTQIAYAALEPEPAASKARMKRDGDLELFGEDHRMTRLSVLDLASRKSRALTGSAYTVNGFRWSPDGTRIAFEHRINPELGADSTTDIAVVNVADGAIRELVTQKGPDVNPVWSPDGTRIAFETSMASPWYYYANTMAAVVPAAGGAITPLTRDFDEDVNLVDWGPDGIWFAALQKTAASLFHLDPATRAITPHPARPGGVESGFSFSRDFASVAFVASAPDRYPEICVAPVATMALKELTHLNDQLAGWPLGTSEVFRWTSRDGAAIEGALRKPPGFRAGKRYPLLIVIHGGPTGVSRPSRFAATYVYPIEAWLARGALVLEPNYRGSAGYGAAFRALNVRNLGVGDAWDVTSGLDALVAAGLADSTRVGVMGWSEGGYISAFLATHESRRFRAISVGAGISDWMTYYVNTDITPFTRQYLHATPWDDPEIYARTSPITTIRDATAPTLIQHGDSDKRVPTPDAFELYRGLMDVGVPTRLALYKGFGHGLNKPKAIRAAMEHNLEWFDRWFWSDSATTARRVAQAPPAAGHAARGAGHAAGATRQDRP